MESDNKSKARQVLDGYLETNDHRKTPERYAILDAVYSAEGHFTLEELGDTLARKKFPVSRATLYNTLKLFVELHLVVRHHFQSGTRYEACYHNANHVHQVCTVCGKVTELQVPAITEAVGKAKLHRFRKAGFTLYIYGVCSTCQSRITRRLNESNKKNHKSQNG